jgi:predicted metal-dependent peptidase
VTKDKDHRWHDREFTNDLIIDGAQIYLSPASLVFYKFVSLFQTVHANYNFPYYKEYMVNYLEEAYKQGKGDRVDRDLLRSSILKNLDSRLD